MGDMVKTAAKKLKAKRENRASQTQKKGLSRSISSSLKQILSLQRTIGNHTVGKLIKSGALQAKLKIGQHGDRYEQEVDRVAEQVMRMHQPLASKETKVSGLTAGNPVQRRYPECKPKKEEEEGLIRAKEASSSTPEITPELESRISAIHNGDQPLPGSARIL